MTKNFKNNRLSADVIDKTLGHVDTNLKHFIKDERKEKIYDISRKMY